MRSLKHWLIVVAVLPFFLAAGAAGGAVMVAGYVLLALPILLQYLSHRAMVANLPPPDENDCTSEEFSAEANWVGGFLRVFPLFALMPAFGMYEFMLGHVYEARIKL